MSKQMILEELTRNCLRQIERRMEALLRIRFQRQAGKSLRGLMQLARDRVRVEEFEFAEPDDVLMADIYATFKGTFTARDCIMLAILVTRLYIKPAGSHLLFG